MQVSTMTEPDVPCILSSEQQPVAPPAAGDRNDDVHMIDVTVHTLGESSANSDDVRILDVAQVQVPQDASNNTDTSDTAQLLANQNGDDIPPTVVTRSRHSGRSRRRRHRRRRRSHFAPGKGKETNFLAAFGSMLVTVCVSTALVEPQWFTLFGGGCRDGSGKPVTSIGMTEFMKHGKFIKVDPLKDRPSTKYVYKFGSSDDQVLYDCVSPSTVSAIYVVLAWCFMVILLSVTAFLLDLAGPTRRRLRAMRRLAVFNILAVLVCVVICGLCYMISEELDKLQDATKLHSTSRSFVEFSVGYYLITAAGAVSVIAASFNLMRTDYYYTPAGGSGGVTSASRDVMLAAERDVTRDSHVMPAPAEAAATESATVMPPPYSP